MLLPQPRPAAAKLTTVLPPCGVGWIEVLPLAVPLSGPSLERRPVGVRPASLQRDGTLSRPRGRPGSPTLRVPGGLSSPVS
jgi:hypothetical protein